MRCFKHSYGALQKALNESPVLNRLLIGSSRRTRTASPDLRADGSAPLLADIAGISAEADEPAKEHRYSLRSCCKNRGRLQIHLTVFITLRGYS